MVCAYLRRFCPQVNGGCRGQDKEVVGDRHFFIGDTAPELKCGTLYRFPALILARGGYRSVECVKHTPIISERITRRSGSQLDRFHENVESSRRSQFYDDQSLHQKT